MSNRDCNLLFSRNNPGIEVNFIRCKGKKSREGSVSYTHLQYFTKQNESLAAELQKIQPTAHIVKAFNSVGAAHMYKPSFKNGKPTMFICGNNEHAKTEAVEILDSFGWEVADMGSIEAAGAIESLGILWCIKGFKEGTWNHAFKLLV